MTISSNATNPTVLGHALSATNRVHAGRLRLTRFVPALLVCTLLQQSVRGDWQAPMSTTMKKKAGTSRPNKPVGKSKGWLEPSPHYLQPAKPNGDRRVSSREAWWHKHPPNNPTAKRARNRQPLPPEPEHAQLVVPASFQAPAAPERFAEELLPRPEDAAVQPTPGETSSFEDDVRPLRSVRTNVKPQAGEMPTDFALERFGKQPSVGGGSVDDQRSVGMVYCWEAAALCHGPLYFEDVNLERYGYSHGIFQPAVSALYFFDTIPKLPYLAGARPCHECVYTLGYYRPGSRVPLQTNYFPWSWRGALYEGLGITGFIFAIPYSRP